MSRQRPRLRNGVDLQLQSAFQDGNWAVAMRLAQQRARTFNDQYFEIVKVCAESQLDDPSSRFVAVAAIDKFVGDGTVVKDIDAIDLLEWFTAELIPERDFPEKIGSLRVRAVKAAPKDKVAATRCLQSCLLHWDLNGAQQIAAMIDRSFPQDRDFMFWNIVITHLLATSSQAPPDKQKLYAMLAQKQIERAAQLTEQAHASQAETGTPARGVKMEQEIMLLYDITDAHGSLQDWEKLVDSPVFSPVAQFRMGRKELFERVVSKYRKMQQWAALCNLCYECLSHTGDDGELTLLAIDWSVWKQYLEAASYLRGSDAGIVTRLQDLLLRIAKSKSLKPIHRRNVLLAKVSAAFSLETNDQDDLPGGDQAFSPRLQALLLYIEDQKTSIACFTDVKEFVEQLDAGGLKYVAYTYVPGLTVAAEDVVASARVNLLGLKLQYLLCTCPATRTPSAAGTPAFQCVVCDIKFDTETCPSCLSEISSAALVAYKKATKEFKDWATVENEILPELAMAVALCNIQLAFHRSRAGYAASEAVSEYLLRALLVLEHQAFLTPKHSQICLVLVQLHLFLGSAHRCREIWQELGVKRTIVDSLAPIFYDRLSTVAPTILDSSDNWGCDLVETLRGHYAKSLRLRMPRTLIEAFEAGSYGSIIDMPKYVHNLRCGCTRAMSLVEEARADRLLGGPCGEFLNDARFYEVPDDLHLRDAIDYGSFPSWASSASKPLHERLSLGPGLANTRAHLSLLVEAFQNILAYNPPTTYKTTAASTGIDSTFVMEMMSQLNNSMSKFLRDAPTHCTASEVLYYETVHLLTTLISLCAASGQPAAPQVVVVDDNDTLRQAINAIKASISTQLDELPTPTQCPSQIVTTLRSLHQMAMLRDTAMASKLSAAWVLSFNERREKGRDRCSLPRDVVGQIKSLQECAEASLKEGKAIIASLNKEVGSGVEFGRSLRQWVFQSGDDYDCLGLDELVEDATVKELVDSWRLNIGGWARVKWK